MIFICAVQLHCIVKQSLTNRLMLWENVPGNGTLYKLKMDFNFFFFFFARVKFELFFFSVSNLILNTF
jgi:hypothetical protein